VSVDSLADDTSGLSPLALRGVFKTKSGTLIEPRGVLKARSGTLSAARRIPSTTFVGLSERRDVAGVIKVARGRTAGVLFTGLSEG
jgi:hypothetical protein